MKSDSKCINNVMTYIVNTLLSTKILSCTTVFNIDNNKKYALSSKSAYIRRISEGSCDTEDWCNDATNLALITGINYALNILK